MSWISRFRKASESSRKDEKQENNPWLDARRTWDSQIRLLISNQQTWQVIAILSMLIATTGIGGIIYIGKQSKFIPYIVHVNELGETQFAGTVPAIDRADPRLIKSMVSRFIQNARMVTPDVALQRRAILELYAHLHPGDVATKKMNEWLNGSKESNPFQRAATVIVETEIASVLPQTQETWQIDWTETVRDRQGSLVSRSAMRSLVNVSNQVIGKMTEEQVRINPLGIYVRDFSWSQLK